MEQGTIARIVADRGFAFIAREGEEKDLFAHASEFDGDFDSFQEGDNVTFEVADGPKGPNATKVNKA